MHPAGESGQAGLAPSLGESGWRRVGKGREEGRGEGRGEVGRGGGKGGGGKEGGEGGREEEGGRGDTNSVLPIVKH